MAQRCIAAMRILWPNLTSMGCGRPLVLGLGLKQYNMSSLQAVSRHATQAVLDLVTPA